VSRAGIAPFEIAASSKAALLAGHDMIGTTLEHAGDIAAYESRQPNYAHTPGAER